MTIIAIHEENHGFIGTATTMKAALRFLIEHNWLTPEFDLYDEETGRGYPIRIHSANAVGVENMRRIIQRNGWKEVK